MIFEGERVGCFVFGGFRYGFEKKTSFIGLFGWRLHCYCSLFWLMSCLV